MKIEAELMCDPYIANEVSIICEGEGKLGVL